MLGLLRDLRKNNNYNTISKTQVKHDTNKPLVTNLIYRNRNTFYITFYTY